MSFGFNETQAAKLIKAAAKANSLAVAVAEDAYYATDTHWIFCIPSACTKLVATIIEATDGEKPDGEHTIGQRKLRTKNVIETFNEIQGIRKEVEEAVLTPWMYEDEEGVLQFVKTSSGKFYPYRREFLRALDFSGASGFNLKLVQTDYGHALVYCYLGPRAIIMGVTIRGIEESPKL